jgi:hypothetical protein
LEDKRTNAGLGNPEFTTHRTPNYEHCGILVEAVN